MALWIIVVILLGSVFSKKRPNHFMAFTMHFIDLYHQSCKRHFCYLIFLAPIEIELGSITSQNWLRLGTDLRKDLGTICKIRLKDSLPIVQSLIQTFIYCIPFHISSLLRNFYILAATVP